MENTSLIDWIPGYSYCYVFVLNNHIKVKKNCIQNDLRPLSIFDMQVTCCQDRTLLLLYIYIIYRKNTVKVTLQPPE